MVKDYLPAIFALLGSITGSLIVWVNNRKQTQTMKENLSQQLKANYVSKNHQEWLDRLRITLSAFYSNAVRIYMLSEQRVQTDDIDKWIQTSAELQLLLDPDDENEKKLLKSINTISDIVLMANMKKATKEELREKIKVAKDEFFKNAQGFYKYHKNKIKNEIYDNNKPKAAGL
jgi:hypothetical protein